ncbi:MAG: hypothetical protein ABW182_09805 [Sphingomonas sp.]
MTPRLHTLRALPMAAGVALMLLAGCSTDPDAANNASVIQNVAPAAEAPEPQPSSAPDAPVAAPSASGSAETDATIGGDGSQIILNPLTRDEIRQAQLPGGLACAFFDKGAAEPLLLAKGEIGSTDGAPGLVKVAGSVEQVFAPGSVDAIRKGTRFAGKGKTLTVRVTGPALKDVESARPATLAYDRADGARRSFTGLWVCRP